MMMNVNQEGFERRLATVQQILHRYKLKVGFCPNYLIQVLKTKQDRILHHAVSTCDANCLYTALPFPFNNFIYKVDLVTPAVPATFSHPQPCTSLQTVYRRWLCALAIPWRRASTTLTALRMRSLPSPSRGSQSGMPVSHQWCLLCMPGLRAGTQRCLT